MIGMEILDLKVVDGDRGFQQFMLDCLDHDILAVAPDEDVPCAQIAGCRPTPDRYVERVLPGTDDLVLSGLHMHQFIRLVYIGLDDLFISAFSRLRVCSVDIFPFRYGLDRLLSRLCQDKRSCNVCPSILTLNPQINTWERKYHVQSSLRCPARNFSMTSIFF